MNNKVIDLFCGMGGFSYGFIQSGFDVLGIDMWDICLKSNIHTSDRVLEYDVSKLTLDIIPENFKDADIVIGSPPCQTFSTANRYNRTKDYSLINHFMRFVNEIKPKIWIWENVVASKCVKLGTILDSQNFGVPQRRKRNFVSNIDISIDIMKKYYMPKKTIREMLPDIKGIGILDGYNSKVYSLDDVCPTIRRIPLKWYDGRFGNNIPKKKMSFTGFEQLSIIEHLILMGFPEDTIIYGNKTEKMIQIGNCVSPKVSLAIARRILEL